MKPTTEKLFIYILYTFYTGYPTSIGQFHFFSCEIFYYSKENLQTKPFVFTILNYKVTVCDVGVVYHNAGCVSKFVILFDLFNDAN